MVKSPSVADFLLGTNYWPRRSAMYMWQRFDAGEIRDDMALIRSLHLKVVRFFLSWEDFQPTRDRIDNQMLDRLQIVMDAIAEHGLLATPTFFTGHMSGVNWLPEWTLDAHSGSGRFRTISKGRSVPFGIGDFYSGPLLDAQKLQVRAVGKLLRDHPALYMWDLGNEFSNLREPNDSLDAANWSKVLSEALLETSGKPVTAGTHGEDLERDRGIRLSSLCAPFEVATMHGYSVYSPFSRGRMDMDVVPFLCQVAQSCAKKPVLFSEFGNPTCPPGMVSPYERVPLPGDKINLTAKPPPNAAKYACLNEEEMSEYGHGVLDRLHKAGAVGAFWWCYADYAKELEHLPPFDKAPHEMSFGIVRQDGSPKPIAGTLKKFAKEKRQVLDPPPPIVNEPQYFAHLPQAMNDAYSQYVKARA